MSEHGFERLTGTERRVLALMADNLTNREISEILRVSPNTVKTHVSHILQKLPAQDRREASRRYRSGEKITCGG